MHALCRISYPCFMTVDSGLGVQPCKQGRAPQLQDCWGMGTPVCSLAMAVYGALVGAEPIPSGSIEGPILYREVV